MSTVAWIVAYVVIGSLLLATFVYVGVVLMKTYSIRKENRRKAQNYGFLLSTPSDVGDNSASGIATPQSLRRLEASVKPPTQPPYSGKCKGRILFSWSGSKQLANSGVSKSTGLFVDYRELPIPIRVHVVNIFSFKTPFVLLLFSSSFFFSR